MTIGPGVRLGPYEIIAPIGSGGMGEVFRAHDTRLDRTVAIKVLAQDRNQNPDMRERFEREARLIATLSHPHICHVNDIGHHGGIGYLVMEHLDGESLAARLARTGQSKPALEIGDVIRYAIEIAEALSEAHRRGIVHRDLKPANVFLARSGAPSSPPTIKLLDFGLAKLQAAPAGVGPAVSAAPTEVALTGEGTIVGTLQYMAPEQLEGKPVDARTDIFAFGIVVYEMATGRRPFNADSQAGLTAAILGTEPPSVSSLLPAAPASLGRIVRKCLAKDPDARWQSARDLADELKWITEAPAPSRPNAARPFRWGWVAALAAALVIATGAAVLIPRRGTIAEPIRRFSIVAPIGESQGADFDFSADGRRLVYRALSSQGSALRLRDLDQLEPQVLPGTTGGFMPVFSPDGQSIAFIANSKLQKLALVAGATPIPLCDIQRASPGMVWLPDNTIILGRIAVGLFRVSADGGTPVALTTADKSRREIDHHSPSSLPGGKAILLTVHRGAEAFDVAVQRLDSNERRVVMADAFDARYLATGHLVFARGNTLFAATFDAERLEVTGPEVPVVDNLATERENGEAAYRITADGSLAYMPTVSRNGRRLAWIDRRGIKQQLPVGPRAYVSPSLSPDGRRLAVQIDDGAERDIWIYDLAADALTRLTFDGASEAPIWTPDGRRVTFSVTQEGRRQIYWQLVDTPGQAELLVADQHSVWPGSWSPDSKVLAYTRDQPTGELNVGLFQLEQRTTALVATGDESEQAPRFSPDGRWLAYRGRGVGRSAIYVMALGGAGGKRQVSTEGRHPVWSRDGHDLFYRTFEGFGVVPVGSLPGAAGKPSLLPADIRVADGGIPPGYDVSPDGQRLLVVEQADTESAPQPIHVVLNWINDLKARVPSR